jgi:hypothetical protein
MVVDLSEYRSSLRGCGESEEAITRVVSLLACERIGRRMWDLDADRIPAHETTNLFCILFVHPGFKLAPPERRACQRGCGRGWGDRRGGGCRIDKLRLRQGVGGRL